MAEPQSLTNRPCPTCGYLAEPSGGTTNFCPKCGQDLRPGAAARTQTNALLGHVIADRYRLIALVGEGGMGAVYKAEHIRMGKALAVKILRGDFASDPGAVARFRSEAQIVSRLSHPHTIAVFDFGEIEEVGGFYLAMEYVPGKDLAQAIRDEGRLPEARVVELGQQILGSLAEAHEAGIVHRDMKPGNVMLMQTRPGEDFAKVLDFGIAKLRDEGQASSTTSAGAIVGTPNYLAPEQARGGEVDARADLYAVGCLLYELAAGRPPFVAPNPMAVVSSHLHDPPPPLAGLADVSAGFAEVIHRALEKRPEARFASADEMRAALLALEHGGVAPRRRLAPVATVPETTGELRIASREDFREFDRQVRALKRSRVAAPLSFVLLLAAIGVGIWRWADVYAFLAARAPAVAAAVPAELRPSDHYDGAEHEPNESAAISNRLPIPAGKDGRPAGGTARLRGFMGAKLSETQGDIDVFRLEIPPAGARRVLVAEWQAEKGGDGIRGLDVTLSLNRERAEAGRTTAPLVTSVDRGGAGKAERLVAAVQPGVYYLSVRERHGDETGPIEKPSDPYLLEVRLDQPTAGEEVEPNDQPEKVADRVERYVEWRALAEENPVSEGAALAGETDRDDPDTFAVAARGPAEAPQAIVAVPDPALGLTATLWVPDATDLAPPRNQDRVRFEPVATGAPGEVLFVALPAVPREGAPALLQLRGGGAGAGRYTVLAVGAGTPSGAAVLEQVKALAAEGRLPGALELAAGFARHVPAAAARREVLMLAAGLAEQAAASVKPDEVSRFDRASRALQAAVFEVDGGAVRYRGAFEARVDGKDALAEEAAVRTVRFAAPCTPAEVATRVEGFVERFPESSRLGEVRLWRARALEEAAAAGSEPALREKAIAAWEKIAGGPAAAEAKAALERLRAKGPLAAPAVKVCPDPGATAGN